jgi:hypothetical protein
MFVQQRNAATGEMEWASVQSEGEGTFFPFFTKHAASQ